MAVVMEYLQAMVVCWDLNSCFVVSILMEELLTWRWQYHNSEKWSTKVVVTWWCFLVSILFSWAMNHTSANAIWWKKFLLVLRDTRPFGCHFSDLTMEDITSHQRGFPCILGVYIYGDLAVQTGLMGGEEKAGKWWFWHHCRHQKNYFLTCVYGCWPSHIFKPY